MCRPAMGGSLEPSSTARLSFVSSNSIMYSTSAAYLARRSSGALRARHSRSIWIKRFAGGSVGAVVVEVVVVVVVIWSFFFKKRVRMA